MNKKYKIIISVLLILILFGAGYYWWKIKYSKPPVEKVVNQSENNPDINPVGKINPLKNIKTNPFE
ncbi:MAG TPA: hypothetical protein VMR49_02870 [Candidatus Paceibacterota bacterium]|jgi:flagellar basal body-associated protein FliL|nr:hypothetical protein [Candidatus Paceibacterota bacterium]